LVVWFSWSFAELRDGTEGRAQRALEWKIKKIKETQTIKLLACGWAIAKAAGKAPG
jgi:hypothetical protein